MSIAEKFGEWAIVEIMGHRVFAGFVTEQMIAGRGFIRIDVPEDRTVSYAIVPAYTKVFGTDAVFSLSPCTEETVRRHIAGTGYRMEGAKLLTPPNQVPAIGADVFAGTDGKPRVFTSAEQKCDHGPYAICDNCARPGVDREPKELVVFDESHVLTPADMDAFANRMGFTVAPAPAPFSKPEDYASKSEMHEFAKSLGIDSITNEDAEAILHSETPPVLNPGDDGFVDPIYNQPF